MSFESILPIFSEDNLGATDGSVLGYLVMGFGVGSTIGILLVAGVRNEKFKGQLLLWTGIASGVTPIVLALMVHTVPAVLITALMGASQATFMAITNVYVITITPDRLRGRVTSLYVLHAGGIMAFANLGYGFLADIISAPVIFITTGVIFLVFLLSIMTGQPILRRIATKGEMTLMTKGATA
jgi:MFS family permease